MAGPAAADRRRPPVGNLKGAGADRGNMNCMKGRNMKTERFQIGTIPAVLYGEPARQGEIAASSGQALSWNYLCWDEEEFARILSMGSGEKVRYALILANVYKKGLQKLEFNIKMCIRDRSATGRGLSPRQEPRIPYALSRSTSEIHRPDTSKVYKRTG